MNSIDGNTREMFGISTTLFAIKELIGAVFFLFFYYFLLKFSPGSIVPSSHKVAALFLMIATQVLLLRDLNIATLEDDALVYRRDDLIRLRKSVFIRLDFRQIIKTEIHRTSWQRLLRIGGDVTLFTLLPEHKEILIRNVKNPQRLVDLIQARKQPD